MLTLYCKIVLKITSLYKIVTFKKKQYFLLLWLVRQPGFQNTGVCMV